MKGLKQMRVLALFGVLIASITSAWGQTFGATSQPNAQTMQSQQIMSGGAYNGTVYEPFSSEAKSIHSRAIPVGKLLFFIMFTHVRTYVRCRCLRYV